MKSLRKGAWQSKRGSSPAIPAYRPPRQTRTSKKAESVLAPEIVACESEANLEIVESKSDSEEDTCFGVVWEKMPEPDCTDYYRDSCSQRLQDDELQRGFRDVEVAIVRVRQKSQMG